MSDLFSDWFFYLFLPGVQLGPILGLLQSLAILASALHLDLALCDLVVDVVQQLLWQVFAVIDPPVHLHILLLRHLVLHLILDVVSFQN